MGQKVNPNGIRIGMTRTWSSTWFASGKRYRGLLIEDVKIKRFIMEKVAEAGISEIEIDRGNKKISVVIHTSKPGVLIGKQGANIEDLRSKLERKFDSPFDLDIREIRNPEANAHVIAETIQSQIQRRMPYRRAAKMAIEKAMQAGALGVKVTVAGRLNGADIARTDLFKDGNIPLQTLRTNVQYAVKHAATKYGTIGIRVWVYTGMVFKNIQQVQSSTLSSNTN